MQNHVIEAGWFEYKDDLQLIRKVVFIDEQDVPKDLEWDGLDEDATHFLALNSAGQKLGCARLLPSGQIGRMAVYKEFRDQGIGLLLLNAAVDNARAKGFDRVFLHAQAYAEEFYRRGGFLPHGELFAEAGIDHIAMEMKLPLASTGSNEPGLNKTANKKTHPPSTNIVRESEATSFSNYEQAINGLQAVIQSAQREVSIFSPLLDHGLFDLPETISALSNFARSAARCRVEIILQDSKLAVERGHRLIDLTRRLDQKMSIKRLGEPFDEQTSSFVLADRSAYWMLPSYEEYNGVWYLNAAVNNQRLRDVFSQAWQKSREDPELRILSI